ncbi:L-fuculose phosphate aldolase [Brachyspira hyodysenteriae]|uniref:L-fuculose-phosphate aldolase n=1 Tax=Brachyspira hyodysenteriae TaxID=159 RepID=UPI00063D9B7F|nr:L-fuculose-phosphate aldolase [Brachyspira hyodysenteriae]KLI22157.1 fuculose phosphate aldolase [Brachyspira hyodysenteriae]TVL75347.1 L-fuculose phosphate aldolase [Brachyspira hyodysenteriae]TVL85827.1 L-fuculose phosphate aldolase [Brachyspira hyodysenteriae]
MSDNRKYLGQQIIDACLNMRKDGVNQGTSGNISLRYKDGMLITPTSMPYEIMTPDDIVFVDGNGNPEPNKKPSSEWRFHLSILKENPNFNAVIHNHAVYSSMVSILNVDCIPAIHYMVGVAGGKIIPCAEYATYGTQELCDNISKVMKGYKACILKNHGLLAADETLEKAYHVMMEVENLARLYIGVRSIGDYNVLSDGEMDIVLAKFNNYGLNVEHKNK